MASLTNVYAKVDWAFRHFESLMREVERYSHDDPFQVVADAKLEGDRIVAKVGHKPIPLDIPFLVGDCLQNLRSALDYLVWELVLCKNNSPSRKNQFPVCNSRESFKNEVSKHRLDGIPQDALPEIDGMQPYHNQELGENPIFVLNELANFSKHRRPILAVLTPVDVTSFITDGSGKLIRQIRCSGDQAARAFSGSFTLAGQEEKMKFEIVSCITFDEAIVKGIEICQGLAVLGQAVKSQIIPRFERFFEV